MAKAARAVMEALGLELFSKSPSPAMTTVESPVDSEKLTKHLFSKYGIKLVGGQDADIGRPLRIEKLPPWGPDGEIERWSVDGTPTDAVYIGLNHVMKGGAPELVASGINRGPNLAMASLTNMMRTAERR